MIQYAVAVVIDRKFPASWMPAGACHRARRGRDPLAGM